MLTSTTRALSWTLSRSTSKQPHRRVSPSDCAPNSTQPRQAAQVWASVYSLATSTVLITAVATQLRPWQRPTRSKTTMVLVPSASMFRPCPLAATTNYVISSGRKRFCAMHSHFQCKRTQFQQVTQSLSATSLSSRKSSCWWTVRFYSSASKTTCARRTIRSFQSNTMTSATSSSSTEKRVAKSRAFSALPTTILTHS